MTTAYRRVAIPQQIRVGPASPFTVKNDRKGRKCIVFNNPPAKGEIVSISYEVTK